MPKKYENMKVFYGKIAAELMKRRYGIRDEDILNAVRYRAAKGRMSQLEKIIYLVTV